MEISLENLNVILGLEGLNEPCHDGLVHWVNAANKASLFVEERNVNKEYIVSLLIRLKGNRPFPSSPRPLFQNEGRCSAFDMEIIFHSHANKTHFHKKGCAPSLILKVRVLDFGSGLFKMHFR